MHSPEKLSEQFHEIFSRHGDALYYYILKLTGNEEKAKDILQECFLRLWENFPTMDTSTSPLPLLITYIKNLLIDDFRKTQRQQKLFDNLKHSPLNMVAVADVEERLDVKERQRQLEDCLSNFPSKRQEIFRMVRQEGMTYKEVAEHLHLSLSDVKKQMGLSLQVLRKVMHLFFSIAGPLLPVVIL